MDKQLAAAGLSSLVLIGSVFIGVAWITGTCRFCTRAFIIRSWGVDDTWMALCLVCTDHKSSFAHFVETITGNIHCIQWTGNTLCSRSQHSQITNLPKAYQFDLGTYHVPLPHDGHASSQSPQQMLITEYFYPLTMLLLKVSIGYFFLRIIEVSWQRRVVWAVMVVSIVANIGYFFFLLFQCGKPAGGEDFLQRQLARQCISTEGANGIIYTHGVLDTLSDVVFASLPYFLLKDSMMNKREKWSTGLILALATM